MPDQRRFGSPRPHRGWPHAEQREARAGHCPAFHHHRADHADKQHQASTSAALLVQERRQHPRVSPARDVDFRLSGAGQMLGRQHHHPQAQRGAIFQRGGHDLPRHRTQMPQTPLAPARQRPADWCGAGPTPRPSARVAVAPAGAARAGKEARRLRKLPPELVTWLLVGMGLGSRRSVTIVIGR